MGIEELIIENEKLQKQINVINGILHEFYIAYNDLINQIEHEREHVDYL